MNPVSHLTLGFSPCPNDTFIFDAMINGSIDTSPLSFDIHLEDVQTLNEWALNEKLDITKISYGVYPLLKDKYRLLESGGALGSGVGPLLIARSAIPLEEIHRLRIAIPGKNTTAHLLFSMAFPEAQLKEFMLFSDIEQAVLNGTVDAGVIIHENRFTYQAKGLHKLIDLGEFWEQQLKCPIPLGGIVAKRTLPGSMVSQVEELIAASIMAGWKRYPELSSFIREHSQEMSEDVMRSHINLYVNDYSRALGEAGHRAVNQLVSTFERLNSR